MQCACRTPARNGLPVGASHSPRRRLTEHALIFLARSQHSLACLRIVNFFSLLSRATADSVVIMSAEHHLVPTLIRVLNDASDVIYGLAGGESEGRCVSFLMVAT